MSTGTALVGLLVGATAVAAQVASPPPSLPVRDVAITVVIDTDRAHAHVHERFELMPGTSLPELRYLQQPCAPVERLEMRRDSLPVVMSTDSLGPWRALRDTSATVPGARGLTYEIDLAVSLPNAESRVPLVVPTLGVAKATPGSSDGLPLEVRFLASGGEGRVILPRMSRSTERNVWRGEFPALPAMVVVRTRRGGSGDCASVSPDRPSSGGLAPRFTAFIAILVLWVPLYMWWVRRDPEGRP